MHNIDLNIMTSALVWAINIVFLKWRKLKILWPVGIIGVAIIFLAEQYLMSLKLYEFVNPFLPVIGIPLFNLIWAFGSAILFISFIKIKFWKKAVAIVIFAVITESVELVMEITNKAKHLYTFTDIHEVILDVLILTVLTFISEGVFYKRIHPSKM